MMMWLNLDRKFAGELLMRIAGKRNGPRDAAPRSTRAGSLRPAESEQGRSGEQVVLGDEQTRNEDR